MHKRSDSAWGHHGSLVDSLIHGRMKRYSSLSEEIRELIVHALIEGDIPPGTRVNDIELAEKLGVSRTPVREALRGLQSLGIIETLPARITRVVTLTTREFDHAKVVWASLYRVLLTETVNQVTDAHVEDMMQLFDDFTDKNEHQFSRSTFRFFNALTSLTRNTFLQESIFTAACRMRLIDREDAENLNPTRAEAQQFTAAIASKDLAAAHNIFSRITNTPAPSRAQLVTC